MAGGYYSKRADKSAAGEEKPEEKSTKGYRRAKIDGKTTGPYFTNTQGRNAVPVKTYKDDAGRVHTWNPRSGIYEVTSFLGRENSTADYVRPSNSGPYYQQSQYGSTPVLEYTDDSGFVQKWNPKTGIYEVIRTVAAPGTAAATAAEAPLDFSLGGTAWGGESADIRSKLQRALGEIGTRSLQSKIGFQDLLRGVRRAETGSLAQLGGAAAETSGYARGPAAEAAGPGTIRKAAARELANVYGAQAEKQAGFAEETRRAKAAAEVALFDLARRVASEADARVRSVLQGEMAKIINALNLGGMS